jgi:hypothetical protein
MDTKVSYFGARCIWPRVAKRSLPSGGAHMRWLSLDSFHKAIKQYRLKEKLPDFAELREVGESLARDRFDTLNFNRAAVFCTDNLGTIAAHSARGD